MTRLTPLLFCLLVLSCVMQATPSSSSAATPVPTPAHQYLVIGGGCFWCLDAAYKLVPGVSSVISGYAGGKVDDPSYRQVCEGNTGHAEVVRIEYDPAAVSVERLLELFWRIHDPTTLNRQGEDSGTQYRSTIMYADTAQKLAAEKAVALAQPRFASPIVTEIVPLKHFWPAEEHHQDFFAKNPDQGYCRYVVSAKVEKMHKALSGAPAH